MKDIPYFVLYVVKDGELEIPKSLTNNEVFDSIEDARDYAALYERKSEISIYAIPSYSQDLSGFCVIDSLGNTKYVID